MKILPIIGWIVFSGIKFFLAPSAVFLSGYSFWETIVITVFGGVLSILGFFFGGSKFFEWFENKFSNTDKKVKRKFSRKNRAFIKAKNAYGLYGLAFITPCILSLPIGSVLAAKYYRYDKRALPFMIGGMVLWSFILTAATSSFGPVSWEDILPLRSN